MTNISDKFTMPTFYIDDIHDSEGHVQPGIKRMYDIALEIHDSIFQWGGPGIGKSQAVFQWNDQKVAEYNKRIAAGEKVKPWNPEVCDVRLSMKEPVDLVGVPTIKVDSKDNNGQPVTVWAVPSVWPKDDGKFSGGVIHLDEMNQGSAAIMNAAFQLIQDRRLGEYKVPDGYLIIASSNPPAFNNTVTELSIPLSNRFSHFNIGINFDSWLQHRMNHGGNADVIAFLKTQNQSMLYDEDTMKKRLGSEANALFTDLVITPRSWEVVEKVIACDKFSKTEKQWYCTGRLGFLLTSQLFNWIEEKEKYQSWQSILVDGKPFLDEDINVFFAVQLACISAINNEKDDKKCHDYVMKYLDATRKLKHEAYKAANVTILARSPRTDDPEVFNPLKDAGDLLDLIVEAMK